MGENRKERMVENKSKKKRFERKLVRLDRRTG